MANVALVEKVPSKTDFIRHFDNDFQFDRFSLCSDKTKKKILKRDVDIDIDIDDYEFIILVGSEALQHFTRERSITEHCGRLIEDKYIPVINPGMLAFKPEARETWDDALSKLKKYISGELKSVKIDESKFYGITDTAEALAWVKAARASNSPKVAVDTETTGLYPRDGYILGISMAVEDETAVYISTDCIDEEIVDEMQSMFREKGVIMHNAKFDLAMLEYHFNFEFPNIDDTMLMSYMLNEVPGNHGLKGLAIKHTPYGDYEKPMYDFIDDYCRRNGFLKGDFTWDMIPFDLIQVYAAMDACVTYRIYQVFEAELNKDPQIRRVYKNLLIPAMNFLKDVQDTGGPFDRKRLEISQNLMEKDIQLAIEKLEKHQEVRNFQEFQGKDFNPNSTLQLRKLLFDFIGLKPTGKKTGTGAHSTDAEVLQELGEQHEVPTLILDIRQKSKIKNTYLDKIIPQLDRDSHLRTNFNLHGTTSGRLSSSGKLNMQQIPRDNPIVKGCIKAKEGHQIVAMDLTTAEVYVAAILAKDKKLQNVFRQGGNFHSTIAKTVFHLPCEVEEVAEYYSVKRQAAKAVTFGIMYGAGPHKISQQVTKDSGTYFSLNEAQEVIDDYFGEFSKLKYWLENMKNEIQQKGYIYSIFGRKRRLPNVFSSDKGVASHEVRSGINFLVQSTASDINLLGAIDMNRHIKEHNLKSRIFALVHDSILAEVPEHEVDYYCEKLKYFVQKPREGCVIEGAPVGCDFDVGEDYSFGKYDKTYGQMGV